MDVDLRKSLREIDRRLRTIEEMLEVSDLMTIEETAKFLDVAKKTIQNNMKGKLAGCYIINKLGHPMFSKSKLISP